MNTAAISLSERSASHRIKSTMAKVMVPLSAAFSLIVANSSSAIGTGPVSRTRAWYFGATCAAMSRSACVASWPGSTDL